MNCIMQSLCYITTITTIFTVSTNAEFREHKYVKTLLSEVNNCLKDKPAYVGATSSKLECSLQCTDKDGCDLFDYSSQDKQCFLSGNLKQRDVGNDWTEATNVMKNMKKEVYVKKTTVKPLFAGKTATTTDEAKTTVSSKTTAYPSTTTASPSTTTDSPSTTIASPSITTASQSTTASPRKTTASPRTTTASPSTTTASPSTTTASLSTTTDSPSTTTDSPSTTMPQTTSEGGIEKCSVKAGSPQVNWTNCADVFKAGYIQSGVYNVTPTCSTDSVQVYCDHSDGGGWTVFQRRINGTVLFNRTWNGYKEGFGDVCGEFWMGNDLLSLMSLETDNTLRVDLQAFNGETAWAQYTNFTVQPENQNYKLQIGTYSGTAGDNGKGLSYHNTSQFSTIDRDNDLHPSRHCAISYDGGDSGWWYRSCTNVNLNGYYIHPAGGYRLYIAWYRWKKSETYREQQ